VGVIPSRGQSSELVGEILVFLPSCVGGVLDVVVEGEEVVRGRMEFNMLLDWEAIMSKWDDDDDVVLSLFVIVLIDWEVSCIVHQFAWLYLSLSLLDWVLFAMMMMLRMSLCFDLWISEF